jgi:hypothetical protein
VARWKADGPPEIPDWVHVDGFDPVAWVEPPDFSLAPEVAERQAEGRWIRARLAFFDQNPDAVEVVMAELRALVRDADG